MNSNNNQTVNEGKAEVFTSDHVFYNPVQEFNRDLSISVITLFSETYQKIDHNHNAKKKILKKKVDEVCNAEFIPENVKSLKLTDSSDSCSVSAGGNWARPLNNNDLPPFYLPSTRGNNLTTEINVLRLTVPTDSQERSDLNKLHAAEIKSDNDNKNRSQEIEENQVCLKQKKDEYLSKESNQNKSEAETIENDDTPIIEDKNKLTILEALSASGLRSIRYAKEIPAIKKIVANDMSRSAVDLIKKNIMLNNIGHLVQPSNGDANEVMHHCSNSKIFDVIDLDPYGCPSTFLDASVKSISEGGLLLITATDMAVLSGNAPETCYTKYGAISLRTKACHEMALRILLQSIESHANRYSRFIVPLLSVSVDFYIRVFVRVFSGPAKCKHTTSKVSHVYMCSGCGMYSFQPLGIVRQEGRNVKFNLPTGPPVNKNCEHCGGTHRIGGPIWTGPLHNKEFIDRLIFHIPQHLGTIKRIEGILTMISEELYDVPLYYTLDKLCQTVKCETPPMTIFRSALLNSGYRVSYSHANKLSIKTDAPNTFIWDVLREWIKTHPVKEKRFDKSEPGLKIVRTPMTHEINLNINICAVPFSKRNNLLRFQENPTSHWGPGTRGTAMVGEKDSKKKRNQNKKANKRFIQEIAEEQNTSAELHAKRVKDST